jgi:hypothetical protein
LRWKIDPTLTEIENPMALGTQMILEEAGEPVEFLQSICEILNGKNARHAEVRSELRGLIARWLKAPTLKEMLYDDRRLWKELDDVWRSSLEPSAETRTATVRAYVIGLPDGPMRYQVGAPHHQAVCFFARLLLNPLCEKLCGPCARCGRYFIKSRSDHDKYCDGGCASAASAAVVMERKRREQRNNQLGLARLAAQEWATSGSTLDWKAFVAQKVVCTKKWVTIAVKNYGLEEPHRRGDTAQTPVNASRSVSGYLRSIQRPRRAGRPAARGRAEGNFAV